MHCCISHAATHLPPKACPSCPSPGRTPNLCRTGRAASSAAYRECLGWALLNAPRLSRGGGTPASADDGLADQAAAAAAAAAAAKSYCQALLQGTLLKHLLPAALGPPGPRMDVATDVLIELLQQLAAAAAAKALAAAPAAGGATPPTPTPLQQLLAAPEGTGVALGCCAEALQQELSSALSAALAGSSSAADDEPGLRQLCERVGALLSRLAGALPSCLSLVEQVAAAAARAVMSSGAAAAGQLPVPASALLASLIREFRCARVLRSQVSGEKDAVWCRF